MQTAPGEPSPWQPVAAVLLEDYHNPDLQAVRASYSCVAAHTLGGPQVWGMAVGPPGSLKTEHLTAMEGLPFVHFIDRVTPQTFISGQIEEPGKQGHHAPSFLQRVGNSAILVYPDFTTILSLHRDHRASILADMRRIYDGHLRKEFGHAGSQEQREWRGRITFMAAATPEVGTHYAVFQSLGERFLLIRFPRPGGTEAALSAMNQNRGKAKKDLQMAVNALLRDLPKIEPKIPEATQRKIAALAELTARGRTHVLRDGHSRQVVLMPEPEASTRIAQQLAQTAKGSALLDRRAMVNEADLQLVRRVAFNCLPATRRTVFQAVISGQGPEAAGLPKSTCRMVEDDLRMVGLLAADSGLSDLARDLLAEVGG